MGLLTPIQILADMLYPKVCSACKQPLLQAEEGLCLHCLSQLPFTDFGFTAGNPVEKLFWGRVSISYATSMLFFDEGGFVRELLHKIKYRGGRDLAVELGKLFALQLLKSQPGYKPDLLVPVPLHRSKLRHRGFNQSEAIASGMAAILGSEICPNFLKRVSNNSTQTKKGRFDRWANVDGIFSLHKPAQYTAPRILLVDDVITTGATLEACIRAIEKVENSQIGIASLALARG